MSVVSFFLLETANNKHSRVGLSADLGGSWYIYITDAKVFSFTTHRSSTELHVILFFAIFSFWFFGCINVTS